jgi:hypothetical protein
MVRCKRCRKAEVVYRLSGPSKSFGDLLGAAQALPQLPVERL